MEGILGLFGGGFRSWEEIYSSTLEGRGELASELFVHRSINVMIHAAIVQLLVL